jgi:hypothetical protein
MVSVSPEFRFTDEKVVSAIIVPELDAVKRPAFCTAVKVPDAVNVLETVNVCDPAV